MRIYAMITPLRHSFDSRRHVITFRHDAADGRHCRLICTPDTAAMPPAALMLFLMLPCHDTPLPPALADVDFYAAFDFMRAAPHAAARYLMLLWRCQRRFDA